MNLQETPKVLMATLTDIITHSPPYSSIMHNVTKGTILGIWNDILQLVQQVREKNTQKFEEENRKNHKQRGTDLLCMLKPKEVSGLLTTSILNT